jgi:hypothetical protein
MVVVPGRISQFVSSDWAKRLVAFVESYCNLLVSTRTYLSVLYGASNYELREGKTEIHVN